MENIGLEKVVEKLAIGDVHGALTTLVGVLVTTSGGLLAEAAAEGMASTILRRITNNPTSRMLEEGKRSDNEREHRQELARCLEELLSRELQPILDKLNSGASEQREDQNRLMRFVAGEFSEQTDSLLRELKPPGPTDEELISNLKQQLASSHGRLVLAGLFRSESPRELNRLFVELSVAVCDSGRGERLNIRRTTGHRVTLSELMVLRDSEQNAPRWVVLGEPGAGKSTLARHLAWKHATEDSKPDAPLIIYASLLRLAREPLGPFELAERELCNVKGARGKGLAEALRCLAVAPHRVWLFLDSLDEVSLDHREQIHERLIDWASEFPKVAIAVFSRRIGYDPIGSPYDCLAKVEPLDRTSQMQLLCGWGIESNRAEEILTGLGPGLRDVCQLPLMATLLAHFVKNAKEIPRNRRQLLDEGIKVLLCCGHRGKGAGIAEPDAAKKVLAALCLELHDLPEESYWTREQLTDTLAKLIDDLKKRWCWRDVWTGPETFLKLVSEQTGILASRDESGCVWQLPHRQFYELLAAQALHDAFKGSSAGLVEFIQKRIPGRGQAGLTRWAEVFGYTCELDDEPLRVLTELVKLDGELALRVLPELEVRDPAKAFQVVANTKWDGDFLCRLVGRWRERGIPRDELEAWLWNLVKEQRSVEQLSFVHYALERLLGKVDRERFFAACQRPLPEGDPRTIRIREGEFWMGSPESEPGRKTDELRHRVRVGAFQICPTAVSNAEYERFDHQHQRELFDGRLKYEQAAEHPVVNVTWWQARLYCAWQGGRLPTEAEWEYACRAGTETAFSFGDEITPDEVNYNGAVPNAGGEHASYRGSTVPVLWSSSNDWGLYQMHGNVLEWCADWYGEYIQHQADNPKGSDTGEYRVLRGGCWGNGARNARSACRAYRWPGDDYGHIHFGFRLVLDR